MDCKNMNFGQALELLKQGKRVRRLGWNGKGMFIYLTKGSVVPFEQMRTAHVTAESTGLDAAYISSHIDMRAADGTVVIGWLASQTDMLAEDWEVLE